MSSAQQSPYIYTAAGLRRPQVLVEAAPLAVIDGQLGVVMVPSDPPSPGRWSLPAVTVDVGSSVDNLARQMVTSTAGVPPTHLEQIHTFDRRGGSEEAIVITYLGVVAAVEKTPSGDDRLVATIDTGSQSIRLVDAEGGNVDCFRWHLRSLDTTLARLRRSLDDTRIAFAFLPDEFTLLDLQQVHQAILGEAINKDSFRRRALTSGLLESTGRRQQNVGHRPAELYRVRSV